MVALGILLFLPPHAEWGCVSHSPGSPWTKPCCAPKESQLPGFPRVTKLLAPGSPYLVVGAGSLPKVKSQECEREGRTWRGSLRKCSQDRGWPVVSTEPRCQKLHHESDGPGPRPGQGQKWGLHPEPPREALTSGAWAERQGCIPRE